MTLDTVVVSLRADAVAVCAGLVGVDGRASAWDGPSDRHEPVCRFVAAHRDLSADVALGSGVRRWLVEAGAETLVAHVLEDGRTLFVVIDARSTPGLARVRLLQASRLLDAPGCDREKP